MHAKGLAQYQILSKSSINISRVLKKKKEKKERTVLKIITEKIGLKV